MSDTASPVSTRSGETYGLLTGPFFLANKNTIQATTGCRYEEAVPSYQRFVGCVSKDFAGATVAAGGRPSPHQTSTLTSLPLSRRAKLWLAAVILLALLATMVGAWISATTLNHQRMDDDTAWSRLSAPLHHSQRVRPSEKDLPATYDRRPFTNKLI